jgi:CubicO group peptidase (beta-lactamase class C family)
MPQTRFGPLPAEASLRCAPTEVDDATGTHLRGTAHDFSARLLGGVCGIAGAFSVLDDLAAFLRYMLDPTQTTESPGFGPDWVKESLQIHTKALTPPRGLFWHPAPGTAHETEGTWVHYGFTGTGMWISPPKSRWAVLLTNKLYYTRDREPLTRVRSAFRSLALASSPPHRAVVRFETWELGVPEPTSGGCVKSWLAGDALPSTRHCMA